MSAPIPDVYEARMLEIAVKIKKDKGDLELPSGGFQVVTPIDGEAAKLHVVIDLQAPQEATEAEIADKEYMAPSAMVDNSDEVVIELSHKV